jgi:hypothetical protein
MVLEDFLLDVGISGFQMAPAGFRAGFGTPIPALDLLPAAGFRLPPDQHPVEFARSDGYP